MNPHVEDERILITGGAGFIGSTLTGRLIEKNRVAIFDNFRRDALSGKPFASHKNLRTFRGDVLDTSALTECVEQVDPTIVIHCAGIAGIDTVVRSPIETMRVNLIGTAGTLDVCAGRPAIKRFLNFSTSEVFGSLAFRSAETDVARLGAAAEGRWTYAVSKLAGEHLAYAYYKERGLPVVNLRPFNVYGPGQVGEGAMREFVLRALADEDIAIHGDGNQIRAWCYVEDFIEGVLRSLVTPDILGESFNIGNARAVITILGLAETVLRVLGAKSNIVFLPARSADIELRIPSVEKARRCLGFEASVNLDVGIARTAEWFRRECQPTAVGSGG